MEQQTKNNDRQKILICLDGKPCKYRVVVRKELPKGKGKPPNVLVYSKCMLECCKNIELSSDGKA